MNMIQKLPKPPDTQRNFANIWSELNYLCKKMRYWMYTRRQRRRAERYLGRLATILRDLPENDVAIVREEGLALFHELKGELDAAIAHREQEIRLTKRLHKDAQSPGYAASTRAYMLRDRETIDLQERQAILEALKKERTRNHKPKQPNRHRSIHAPWSPSAT